MRLGHDRVKALMGSLHAATAQLAELNLSGNLLDARTGTHIARYLRTDCAASLTSFDVSRNSLRSEGAADVLRAVSQTRRSLTLDIASNEVSSVRWRDVTRCRTVSVLRMDENNLTVNERRGYMGTSAYCTTPALLTVVHLIGCNINSHALHEICSAMISPCAVTMTDLRLDHNALTDDCVAMLGAALAGAADLAMVSLSHNCLSDSAADGLCHIMTRHRRLRSFDVSGNRLHLAGVEALSTATRKCPELAVLATHGNMLTIKECDLLFTSVRNIRRCAVRIGALGVEVGAVTDQFTHVLQYPLDALLVATETRIVIPDTAAAPPTLCTVLVPGLKNADTHALRDAVATDLMAAVRSIGISSLVVVALSKDGTAHCELRGVNASVVSCAAAFLDRMAHEIPYNHVSGILYPTPQRAPRPIAYRSPITQQPEAESDITVLREEVHVVAPSNASMRSVSVDDCNFPPAEEHTLADTRRELQLALRDMAATKAEVSVLRQALSDMQSSRHNSTPAKSPRSVSVISGIEAATPDRSHDATTMPVEETVPRVTSPSQPHVTCVEDTSSILPWVPSTAMSFYVAMAGYEEPQVKEPTKKETIPAAANNNVASLPRAEDVPGPTAMESSPQRSPEETKPKPKKKKSSPAAPAPAAEEWGWLKATTPPAKPPVVSPVQVVTPPFAAAEDGPPPPPSPPPPPVSVSPPPTATPSLVSAVSPKAGPHPVVSAPVPTEDETKILDQRGYFNGAEKGSAEYATRLEKAKAKLYSHEEAATATSLRPSLTSYCVMHGYEAAEESDDLKPIEDPPMTLEDPEIVSLHMSSSVLAHDPIHNVRYPLMNFVVDMGGTYETPEIDTVGDVSPPRDHNAAVTERVLRFYAHYNPEKVHEIADIMARFAGREGELMGKLVEKYGPEPPMTTTPPRHRPPFREMLATRRKEHHLEKSLSPRSGGKDKKGTTKPSAVAQALDAVALQSVQQNKSPSLLTIGDDNIPEAWRHSKVKICKGKSDDNVLCVTVECVFLLVVKIRLRMGEKKIVHCESLLSSENPPAVLRVCSETDIVVTATTQPPKWFVLQAAKGVPPAAYARYEHCLHEMREAIKAMAAGHVYRS